jgi:hypothetical protein
MSRQSALARLNEKSGAAARREAGRRRESVRTGDYPLDLVQAPVLLLFPVQLDRQGSKSGGLMQERYLPALRAKAAEFAALAELDPATKQRILPLVEVPPAPRDRNDPSVRRPLGEHLAAVAPKLAKSWGTDQRILLGFPHIPPGRSGDDLVHPTTAVFTEAAELEVRIVPVVGLESDPAYLTAAKTASSTFKEGIAIRLADHDLADLRSLDYRLRKLLATIGVERDDVDMIIDLRQVSTSEVATRAAGTTAILRRFPARGAWRTMTLLSGAFPESLANLRANNIRRVRRADWELWRSVIADGVPRNLMFGDYAVDNPAPFDPDNPKAIQVSANIRYTSADVWLVLKGTSTKKDGWEQTMRLSKVLADRDEFMGAGYSAGDAYIAKRARGTVKCGNPTVWRRVAVTHHITMATLQLASYGAP